MSSSILVFDKALYSLELLKRSVIISLNFFPTLILSVANRTNVDVVAIIGLIS
jgi:hypothetical protein